MTNAFLANCLQTKTTHTQTCISNELQYRTERLGARGWAHIQIYNGWLIRFVRSASHAAHAAHAACNGESASESPLRRILGRQNVAASPAWPWFLSFYLVKPVKPIHFEQLSCLVVQGEDGNFLKVTLTPFTILLWGQCGTAITRLPIWGSRFSDWQCAQKCQPLNLEPQMGSLAIT